MPQLDHLLEPGRTDESRTERFKGFVGDRVDEAFGKAGDLVEWSVSVSGAWVDDRLTDWGEQVDDVGDELAKFADYLGNPEFADAIDRFGDDFEDKVDNFGNGFEAQLTTAGSFANKVVDHGMGGVAELLINHDTRAEILKNGQADIDQIWLHRQEFPGAGEGGAWQSQALGLAMAGASTCNTRTVLDGGIILYENCDAGAAEEFLESQGNPIFTLGNFIFARGSLNLTDVSSRGDVETLFEEIAHVHQYATLGDRFLPEYLENNDQVGYAGNPLELEAKAAAHEMLQQYRQRLAAPSTPQVP